MKCPWCNEGIHDYGVRSNAFPTENLVWFAYGQNCPECKKPIVDLIAFNGLHANQIGPVQFPKFRAYPKSSSPRPVPPDVLDPYRSDFDEAVAVLSLSPKASAALSRRNLQAILRDKAGAKGKDLNAEIQFVIDSGIVPSYISEGLHAVRQIGNFAAHPIKSTSTGEIVDVEEGEAEWDLDVLESLFDFYFVQPAITANRKSAINVKLKDAGKKPI
jgi:hypothetical protein